jgi:hypothetical protein
MKDEMLNADGISINKVLFGRKAEDMFFFFEKYKEDSDVKDLYISVLDLKGELFQNAYKNRFTDAIDVTKTNLDSNCKKIRIKEGSLLEFFVRDFNSTAMESQR